MQNLFIHNEYDKSIIKEIKPTYGWTFTKDNSNEVILDVGANFGAYTVYAHMAGVRSIYAYEPEPSNYDLLSKNTKGKENVHIFNKALISGDEPKTLDFFIPRNRKNMGSSSLHIKRGRDKIEVGTENYQRIIDEIKPTTVKMDCEGAEYDLLLNNRLPDSVRKITIELHFGKGEWRNDLVYKVMDVFKTWEVVRKPVITEANWHTIAKYKR